MKNFAEITSSLDDEVYKLATEVRTMVADRPEVIGGGVIKQNVTRSLTIDLSRYRSQTKT